MISFPLSPPAFSVSKAPSALLKSALQQLRNWYEQILPNEVAISLTEQTNTVGCLCNLSGGQNLKAS